MATNISPEQVQAVLKKLGFNPTLEQATTLIDLLTSITIAVIREQAEKQLITDELELLSRPGDTIVETLEAKGMHLLDFALAMSRLPDEINDIISGKTPINNLIAQQLEQVLGIDAQFWLNRDRDYRAKLLALQNKQL